MKVSDLIVENFDKINQYFNLGLRDGNKGWYGLCPLHGGDNPSSFTLYKEGSRKWLCHTHACHTDKNSAIGFVAELLKQKYDRDFNYYQAKEWVETFFKVKTDEVEQYNFDDKLTSFITKLTNEPTYSFKITEKDFLSRLQRPAHYFLDRKYKEQTLDYFKLGYCPDPTKPMYLRVVVPQYSEDGKFIVGCLGRIIFDKCKACNHYHNPKGVCRISHKWKNSTNFPSSTSLFNFHNAKKYIEQTGIVLMTEGSPNVMRLHEAGFPMAVASYGSKFSEYQRNLLDTAGCHTIINVRDVGDAGDIMVEQVKTQCKFTHNIITVEPFYEDDVGDCNIEVIKKIIGPYVDGKRI